MSSDFITVPSWINGVEVTHGQHFKVMNPSTGKVCWKTTSATASDAIAANAFSSWSASKPSTRQSILVKATELLESRADELANVMSTEMGADFGTARHIIIPLAINMMRDAASRIPSICGSVPVVQAKGQSAMVWKVPYGVVLGIVPWNAPYVFGVRSAATAIATGNTTVIKASEFSPRSYWALCKIFQDAGLPYGVLNMISCRAEDAATIVNAMIEHPSVKKVKFTGSTVVGRSVARSCGQNLKPILLELGGKNSAIILPDADLNKAARECFTGAFANAGQTCMSTDTMIVHEKIAPDFLRTLKEALIAMQECNNTLPVVVSTASAARVASLVTDAVEKGAKIFHGSSTGPSPSSTAQIVPTVLENVSREMEIWEKEAFAPLMAFVIVKDEVEAIKVVNGSDYGLSASVFTQDLRKAFDIAKKLETGAVHINSMTLHDETALPFGGIKNSGWGRFNSTCGMEEFLVTKSVTWDDYQG